MCRIKTSHCLAPQRMIVAMKIGYARVSSKGQHLESQLDALTKAGCERIYSEKMSGIRDDRPELASCLESLSSGDVLVVYDLSRLGRSMLHLLATVEELRAREIGFQSLKESIDTTSATGKLIFRILGALAEFQRELQAEKQAAGITAAIARGKRWGPPTVMNDARVRLVRELLDRGEPRAEIARAVGIHRATLYRWLDSESQLAGNAL